MDDEEDHSEVHPGDDELEVLPVSARAVVEHRQQIGVMRAIGFRTRMVHAAFLLESSFVALTSIVVGTALGLLRASSMIRDQRAQPSRTRELEVRGHPKFQLSRRGTIVLSTTASPGLVRTAFQTSCSDAWPLADVAETEGGVPGERLVEPAHEGGLEGRPAPTCFASTASTDWLPTAVNRPASTPGPLFSALAGLLGEGRGWERITSSSEARPCSRSNAARKVPED